MAKRIIRPGSNRVVCLAARTSVPLDEEAVASVSDLALRLSDGTNVVLSLGFFNDSTGGEVIPLTRSLYNPNRYATKGNPRLATVIVACVLAALAGQVAQWRWPFLANILANPAVHSLPQKAGNAPSSTGKFKKEPDKVIAARPAAGATAVPWQKSESPNISRDSRTAGVTGKSPYPKARLTSSRSKIRNSGRSSPGRMFIPPPPPTSYGMPFSPQGSSFDPMLLYGPTAKTAQPVSKSSPATFSSAPKPSLPPPSENNTNAAGKFSTTAQKERTREAGAASVNDSAPSDLPSKNPASPGPEWASAVIKSQETSAPVPGGYRTQAQSERVVADRHTEQQPSPVPGSAPLPGNNTRLQAPEQ